MSGGAVRVAGGAVLKVLLVDDHRLFLDGLRVLVEGLAEEVEVLQATSGAQALACVQANPDLDWVFLDLQLPDTDGLAVLQAFVERRVRVPVIVLSGSDEGADVERALALGASGYVPKSADADEIRTALRAIERNGRYLSPAVRAVLERHRARAGSVSLTGRQREVLALMAQGLSNRAIAARMGVTESTVKGHVAMLFASLGASNRTHCVSEARRVGLID